MRSFVGILFLAAVADTFDQMGNMPEIAAKLKPALVGANCTVKARLLDNFMDMNFDAIAEEYGVPKPDFGGQGNLARLLIRRAKTQTVDFSCEQKAELIDAALDGKFDKVRALLKSHGRKDDWGNLPEIGKQLKVALEGQSCEAKAEVFHLLLEEQFQELKEKFQTPLPDYGNVKQMITGYVTKLKDKAEGLSCEQKSMILDAVLDGQFQKIRKIIKESKNGLEALEKLGRELKVAVKGLNCQKKNEILDNLLTADWDFLEKFGISKPDFGKLESKMGDLAGQIAKRVENMPCEDKAKLFDDLIHGRAADLVKKNKDKIIKILRQVKEKTKQMVCEEKNKVFDLIMDGKIEQAAKELEVVLPVELPIKLPENAVHFLEKVKAKTEEMSCENKALVFDELIARKIKKIAEKFGVKLH